MLVCGTLGFRLLDLLDDVERVFEPSCPAVDVGCCLKARVVIGNSLCGSQGFIRAMCVGKLGTPRAWE
jgi:hypothetical protein